MEMTIEVIKAELFIFNNHLAWHKYNCLAAGIPPICDWVEVLAKWKKIYYNIFMQSDNYILKIPSNISHKKFLITASEILLKI